MKTYSQIIIEMSDEVSKFSVLRDKIASAKTFEDLEIACHFFISYNEIYGDKELAKRLKAIMNKECNVKTFVLKRAKKKLVSLFNWYNKQRNKPEDINEKNG